MASHLDCAVGSSTAEQAPRSKARACTSPASGWSASSRPTTPDGTGWSCLPAGTASHSPTGGRAPASAYRSRPAGAPYSDRAILSNAWTRAWLLLDIDEIGRVRRFKYIKRPGHDLEKITAREAFKLRFEPARNRAGRPVGTWMIWLIEWPSYWWLVETFGTASRMPRWVMTDREGGSSGPARSLANSVPCAGSGPLWFPSARAMPAGATRLDERGRLRDESPMSSSSLRVYRDCSAPDLSKDFDAEPWIVSPTTARLSAARRR